MAKKKPGTIRLYFDEKRYGFITPDSGGKDVFFHISVWHGGKIAEGMKVFYRTKVDRRGRIQACGVRPVKKCKRQHGKVKFYDGKKGFGFVTCDYEGRDFFFDRRDVLQAPFKRPKGGMAVSFDVIPAARPGQHLHAVNLGRSG